MLEAPTIARSEPPELTAEQLLETARLAAVGGITSEVVHELNNPLFAILGLVEMLLTEAEPGSKLEHRLGLVHQTGLEMRQLVRALGDFARGTDEIAVVDVADVVGRATDITSLTTATKDVEVAVRLAGEPLHVLCGRTHLAAVVLDLITRARRALPSGGTVIVTLARHGDCALVHIAAQGEPAASLDLDTGIGIAVDAAAVQALGGTLTHGPGAEFSVHLPLNDEETAS